MVHILKTLRYFWVTNCWNYLFVLQFSFTQDSNRWYGHPIQVKGKTFLIRKSRWIVSVKILLLGLKEKDPRWLDWPSSCYETGSNLNWMWKKREKIKKIQLNKPQNSNFKELFSYLTWTNGFTAFAGNTIFRKCKQKCCSKSYHTGAWIICWWRKALLVVWSWMLVTR